MPNRLVGDRSINRPRERDCRTNRERTEQRKTRRYDLSLLVIIRDWRVKESLSCNGKTRDISSRGVYFTTDQNLSPGAALDITLRLPLEVTRDSEVFIRARGKVVRIEKK